MSFYQFFKFKSTGVALTGLSDFADAPVNTQFERTTGEVYTKSDAGIFNKVPRQVASTTFVQDAVKAMYPIGSIYSNIAVSTNPSVLFGFGTWVAITGRVVVGLDPSDPVFDTVGGFGGTKDAIVVSHTHTATDTGHTHTYGGNVSTTSQFPYAGGGGSSGLGTPLMASSNTNSANANISVGFTGSNAAGANLPPYVVAYVWKRTA